LHKTIFLLNSSHGRSQGGKGAMAPHKFIENIVILCFERRLSKQNTVIRLKLNILPPKFLGWLRHQFKCNQGGCLYLVKSARLPWHSPVMRFLSQGVYAFPTRKSIWQLK